MNHPILRWLPAVALCLPLLAGAADANPPAPSAETPPRTLPYRSAFADYRPWQDTPLADWRALNDRVRDAGAPGAATAAPAASAATPAASPPPRPAAVPVPAHAGHAGHAMPGARP